MSLKSVQPLGLSLFLLTLAIPTTTGRGANSYSITGAVTDQQKKAISGVMVTAFDAVEDKMITVFTREGGRFKLPGLTNRDYKVRVRLPGFEDDFTNVAYKSGASSPVSFHLKPAANPRMQETGVDRIRLIKWPTDEARLNFRMACAYCHQVGTEGFRAPKEKADWDVMVRDVMSSRIGLGASQRDSASSPRNVVRDLQTRRRSQLARLHAAAGSIGRSPQCCHHRVAHRAREQRPDARPRDW